MAAVSDDLQLRIADRFAKAVRARAQVCSGVALHEADKATPASLASRIIVPLTVLTKDGSFAGLPEAQRIQAALREPGCAPICHVGQAVSLGTRTVLRVAASASIIAGVARRMGGGIGIDGRGAA